MNVVNLTYRNVPALQKAAEMVREGALGQVRHLEASYLQSWLTQPAWGEWTTEPRWLWRLSARRMARRACWAMSASISSTSPPSSRAKPVADLSCRLKTYRQGAEGDRIGDYVLDANDGFAMHLALAGGAIGTVSASRMSTGHFNDLRLRLYGDKGGLEVMFEKRVSALRACLGQNVLTEVWHEVETPPVTTNYERFVEAIRGGELTAPSFARGAELQEWLDIAERSDAEAGRALSMGDSLA